MSLLQNYEATMYVHGPYADWVEGLGGYNCYHQSRCCHGEKDRRYRDDPLKGTGYTREQAYEARSQQRAMENDIRRMKRQKEVLDANSLDAHDVNVRIRAKQAQLRKHVEEHKAILKRDRWREQLPGLNRVSFGKIENMATRIEIDEMTPCLRRLSDGEIVNTSFKRVEKPKRLPDWEFDWSKMGKGKQEVYALYADGDNRVQGMLAVEDRPDFSAVYVNLVEGAPFNNAHNKKRSGKEYAGVGAHLFAEAVKISYNLGYDGFIVFDAKTELIDYYAKELGAVQMGSSQRMFVDEDAAARLYERYYGKREV